MIYIKFGINQLLKYVDIIILLIFGLVIFHKYNNEKQQIIYLMSINKAPIPADKHFSNDPQILDQQLIILNAAYLSEKSYKGAPSYEQEEISNAINKLILFNTI